MKRLAIACLVVACAAALIPPTLEAGVGIKAGYSLAKISQAPTVDWKNLSFFTGGLSFEAGLGFISLQPEVLYVRMGGKLSAGGFENRLNYIQVPVLLKIAVVPAGPIRPFFSAGAYGSYLIKAEGVMVVDGETQKADLTADYQRLDYGAVGGVGLAFKLALISVSVEGRYNYGLMNIMKGPGPGESMKNRCMMALVGVSF